MCKKQSFLVTESPLIGFRWTNTRSKPYRIGQNQKVSKKSSSLQDWSTTTGNT